MANGQLVAIGDHHPTPPPTVQTIPLDPENSPTQRKRKKKMRRKKMRTFGREVNDLGCACRVSYAVRSYAEPKMGKRVDTPAHTRFASSDVRRRFLTNHLWPSSTVEGAKDNHGGRRGGPGEGEGVRELYRKKEKKMKKHIIVSSEVVLESGRINHRSRAARSTAPFLVCGPCDASE